MELIHTWPTSRGRAPQATEGSIGLTAAQQQWGEPADKQHTQTVTASGALYQAFQVQKESGSCCFTFHLQISSKMPLMTKLTHNSAEKAILEKQVS